MKTLGELVDDALVDRGLSLTQLAELTGIERSHLSRIASDSAGIGHEKLTRLADVLGLDHGVVLRAAAAAERVRREAPRVEPTS